MKMTSSRSTMLRIFILVLLIAVAGAQNGSSVYYDFRTETPGRTHKITVNDLPAPGATKSAVNPPEMSPRPADAAPKAAPGFQVNQYASGLDEPRELRTAPNGDVFLAESDKGKIVIYRGITNNGKAEQTSTFATGLHQPAAARGGGGELRRNEKPEGHVTIPPAARRRFVIEMEILR